MTNAGPSSAAAAAPRSRGGAYPPRFAVPAATQHDSVRRPRPLALRDRVCRRRRAPARGRGARGSRGDWPPCGGTLPSPVSGPIVSFEAARQLLAGVGVSLRGLSAPARALLGARLVPVDPMATGPGG